MSQELPDGVELPPLPVPPRNVSEIGVLWWVDWEVKAFHDYARSAILADREKQAARVPEVTDAMIDAANRNCRNDEQCRARWVPGDCESCRSETAEDLQAAMLAAPTPPASAAGERELLNQALDALSTYQGFIDDAHILEGQWHWIDDAKAAEASIRAALASKPR